VEDLDFIQIAYFSVLYLYSRQIKLATVFNIVFKQKMMKGSITLIFISFLFLVACNSEQKNESANKTDSLKSNAVDNIAERASALQQFNSLEKLFDNQNYLIVQGTDSSYFYFSRQNDYLIKTHSYKMFKGDSDQLRIDTILMNDKNKIQWNWKGTMLQLKNCTAFIAEWNILGADNSRYQFQKTDNNKIELVTPQGNKMTLQKTITLSNFLVRSFYDYQHGTKLAFDSTNFTKRK
jgi:hypothetical protein